MNKFTDDVKDGFKELKDWREKDLADYRKKRDEREKVLTPEECKAKKKELRASVRKAVANLDPAYIEHSNEYVRKNILALPEYQHAKTVFCFVSMDTEVDTHELIRQMLKDGKTVGVPRCEKLGVMDAYEIHSLEDDLEPGTWGILEPKESCPLIDPQRFDFAVVPCCTCSHDGKRLGFGGGFYDRYLGRTGAIRAVVCREQLMSEDIPTQEFDLTMDIVVSEDGFRRIK